MNNQFKLTIGIFLLCSFLSPVTPMIPAEMPKPNPQISSSRPKIEIAKEKRPYGDINVIMYMTTW